MCLVHSFLSGACSLLVSVYDFRAWASGVLHAPQLCSSRRTQVRVTFARLLRVVGGGDCPLCLL